MTPIKNCIVNKDTTANPIWLMRQAGRYLPEFRAIRKQNQDFIKLCLNSDLASEITLQPIKRFGFDGAIIFSDILMLPYAMDQEVKFEKGFGPKLGKLNIEKVNETTEENFTKKLSSVYKAITQVSQNDLLQTRDMIGFVGAPWTILVYMINRSSPKNGLSKNFFNDHSIIKILLESVEKFLKLHIYNQVNAGANVIQIFDSWAGLLEDKIPDYIYKPTFSIVEYVKKLGVPIICFPREIKDYKNYCNIVKPDAINIDYNVDPISIQKEIKIPIQGGMDPKTLLTDKENLKRETKRYLDVFKDHPYTFNLGHGVLPETDPNMVDYLVKMVKDY
tara:strand:- start:102 stop:1100 length:999 start_codon:yes stop_codon:yes gene_type:complete